MHLTIAPTLLASEELRRKYLVPVNHGAKIRIHFFSLRMERSGLYHYPHFQYWQQIVDDHMSTTKTKLLFKDNSFDCDSGFSDG
jgi:hypothetical protein